MTLILIFYALIFFCFYFGTRYTLNTLTTRKFFGFNLLSVRKYHSWRRCTFSLSSTRYVFDCFCKMEKNVHDIEEHRMEGEPICVSTRSNHWSGPFKCTSIQQGVDVTVWRRYSAPQPLTKDILIVHILVRP